MRLLAAAALPCVMTAAAQAPGSGLMTLPGEAMALLSSPQPSCLPQYPISALRAQVEGETGLKAQIDPSGHVASVEVVRSAGDTPEHKLLDQAAVQAFQGCPMFRPKFDASGQAIAYALPMAYRWLLPSRNGKPRPTAHPARLSSIDKSCRPAYPTAALRAHVSGRTRVRVTLDAAAKVRSTEIIESAGETPEHKLLDQAASQALSRCPYSAATDWDGKAVGAVIELTYVWKLD